MHILLNYAVSFNFESDPEDGICNAIWKERWLATVSAYRSPASNTLKKTSHLDGTGSLSLPSLASSVSRNSSTRLIVTDDDQSD